MINVLKHILFMALLLAGRIVCGQVSDAGLWMSVNLEKKITPALSASFTEEVRMNENITEVGLVYSDLGLAYKLWNKFRIGVDYRFTKKRRLDDTYETYHSWYIDLNYREKFKPITGIIRLRYQSKYNEAFAAEDATVLRSHLRTKLTVKYDLDKKAEPYVSGELFFRLNNVIYNSFDQLRVAAGVEYRFNRMHMLDLHYLICREYNVRHPVYDYVIGLGYYFTF